MLSLDVNRRLIPFVTLVLAASPLRGLAAIGDTVADHVIGQPTASSGVPNVTGVDARGVSGPIGVAFDGAGNLFVADFRNHRVLGYLSPMTTDRIADLVIGQPDFNSNAPANGGVSASSLSSPLGLAVDGQGDLFVADAGNNRVLEYTRPFETDSVADLVIGQPDFESREANNGGIGPASLNLPSGIAVDAGGNLWVADLLNGRVLEYDDPKASSDASADLVLGARSFETNDSVLIAIGAATLHFPLGVGVDSQGNVWVADAADNRVLEYDDPKRFDTTADRVLGQPSFASIAPNFTGSVDASGLSGPSLSSVDTAGNVYVCDRFNNRLLMFSSPLATADRIADRVFGQRDFGSGDPNTGGRSARTLSSPLGVAIDSGGSLAVADFDNNRVLLFDVPTPIITSLRLKQAASGRLKLVVDGVGMVADSAVVEIDGARLATASYRDIAPDGSAGRLVVRDRSLETIVRPGVEVSVTVFNPSTGGRSAPVPFSR